MKILFILIILIVLMSETTLPKDKVWAVVDSFATSLTYNNISCYDGFNCMAYGNNHLQYPWNRVTTDGGKTWFTSLRDTAIIKDSSWYFPPLAQIVVYPDSSLCIATLDSGYYWKSVDRCRTWKKYKLPTDYYLPNASFNGAKYGAIINGGDIFITSDSANNFSKVILPDSLHNKFIFSIYLTKNNTIVSAGSDAVFNQYLLISPDFGKTWSKSPIVKNGIDGLFFIDQFNGWAISAAHVANNTYSQIILHTTNGGQTWEKQLDTLVYSYRYLNWIHFYNDSLGITNNRDQLWITTNAGKTWALDTTFLLTNYDWYSDFAILSPGVYLGINQGGYICKYDNVTGIPFEPNKQIPGDIYPNPASVNDIININYFSDIPEEVEPIVYNSIGEQIEKIPKTFAIPGFNKIRFYLKSNLSEGVYFVRINSNIYKLILKK